MFWRLTILVYAGLFCWSLLYSAILCSQADSLCLHVILDEWLAFYNTFLNIHRSGVLTALTWLVPRETVAISVCCVSTIQPCYFMQSHIIKCKVTCHLHFWQNDHDLLCATVVTWGWNGYQNKSQHRKLTLEKIIFPPNWDSNPWPFNHKPGTLTTELSLLPRAIWVFPP